MDDPLDDDLKKRIREVFDNFEDASADEGWLLLREKFPEKAKRRPVAWLWWGSVAAVLLLLLGVLFFKQNKTNNGQQLTAAKKNPIINSTSKNIEAQKEIIKKDSSVSAEQDQAIANNVAGSNKVLKNPVNKIYADNNAANLKETAKLTGQRNLLLSNQAKLNGHQNIANNKVGRNNNISNQIASAVQFKKNTTPQPVTPNPNNDKDNNIAVIQPKDQSLFANRTSKPAKADTGVKQQMAKSNSVNAAPGVNMMEQTKKANKTLFADDEPVKPLEKTDHSKKVVFGVYAATYFNYAKGSNNQLNVGAGVTSDINLSSNLKFSTGVTIAQNSLNYQNQPPVNSPIAAQVAATAPKNTYFALQASSIYTPVSSNFKSYDASLVGLDIPLNLKYEFNPQKGDTYILAGLSSGTFINESYTYSYTNQGPFSLSDAQQQNQSTHQNFDSFYFAKTLNFAFGTGLSLGGNRLVIEPFLKYPLDGLGSQQLKFGAGGVNLKFNFSK